MPSKVKKRDGSTKPFEESKITEAIFKALTSTNAGNRSTAEKLSKKVVKLIERRFKKDEIPDIEQIQDIVEEVLMIEDLVETAKAFILYREKRRQLREITLLQDEAVEIYDAYIDEMDWQVKENANMAYSLQGLNNYGVASLTKRYWLNKLYSKEVRESFQSGDFHIHDLDVLGAYCCGWDLYDLLLRGFGGVSGKVGSKPPKHFRTALGQVVNFFYTLCGEIAGAVAFSNFDTLLAPFIRYDNLGYDEVKQCMQEFMFNCAVPTRVGFQCLSEDTEILTPEGWKTYHEVEKGKTIYTFNLRTKAIEQKKVDTVFKKEYEGEMYNLKNRSQNQLISPRHRVVRQVFNTNKYVLEPIEQALKLKSPIAVPVVGENVNPDYDISDEQLKLIAWVLSEGSVEKDGSHRVSIYQSPVSSFYSEIKGLLHRFDFTYTERTQVFLGTCSHIRLRPVSSRIVHELLGSRKKEFPEFLLNLSKRQARLFLETYVKWDGWEEEYRKRITTTNKDILKGLEALAVLAGYNFSVKERKPQGIAKKLQYVLTLTETKNDWIMKIEKVNYKGVIWSVHTGNETVIAKRKGQVFITGNTPFSNITLDFKPSPSYATQPVVRGGELQNENYGDFQEEMDMLNRAFYEVVMAGDKNGRIFTFPIPTVNITKDFDWNDPALEKMWEATGKYGVNYFANFLQSDMKPEDVRSMCCRLRLSNKELMRKGGGFFGANPLTGSIGVATVNLPRIGYLSKTKREFFERLDKVMDLCRDSLETKRKALDDFIEKGLYPYSKHYLENVKKMRGSYYGNHFSTIGLLGLNECLLNFLGLDIGSEQGRKFSAEVLEHMRKRLVKYQEETGNLYNLEATPAEGVSYRLPLKDRKKFPGIITAGTKETPYYTNSSQLPVNYTDDAFEALDLQDGLQTKYTGGTVLHFFLGERIKDTSVLKNLVRTAFSNYRLPYITLTPTFSICPSHGYLSGERWTCPKCTIEQPCEVYSRVVGYLRPVQQWHEGKAQEFKERKNFQVKDSSGVPAMKVVKAEP